MISLDDCGQWVDIDKDSEALRDETDVVHDRSGEEETNQHETYKLADVSEVDIGDGKCEDGSDTERGLKNQRDKDPVKLGKDRPAAEHKYHDEKAKGYQEVDEVCPNGRYRYEMSREQDLSDDRRVVHQ